MYSGSDHRQASQTNTQDGVSAGWVGVRAARAHTDNDAHTSTDPAARTKRALLPTERLPSVTAPRPAPLSRRRQAVLSWT